MTFDIFSFPSTEESFYFVGGNENYPSRQRVFCQSNAYAGQKNTCVPSPWGRASWWMSSCDTHQTNWKWIISAGSGNLMFWHTPFLFWRIEAISGNNYAPSYLYFSFFFNGLWFFCLFFYLELNSLIVTKHFPVNSKNKPAEMLVMYKFWIRSEVDCVHLKCQKRFSVQLPSRKSLQDNWKQLKRVEFCTFTKFSSITSYII